MSRKPEGFETHPAHFIQAPLRGIVHQVTDGDTMIVEVDLGFNKYEWQNLRLFNLNAPEIFKPKDDLERRAGLAAKARVTELADGKPVLLITYKDKEKYGRYLASVFLYYEGEKSPWQNLEKRLVAEGLAAWLDPNIPPATLG